MNDLRGSQWRKWDLHVHSPSSYDYKDKSVTNDDIIKGLKDAAISVVAVTDHHLIDTQRIKNLKEIANDDITIFPGIEFCSDTRGNEPVHFIGIFPEDCDVDYIWNEINSQAGIAKKKQEGRADSEIYCDLEETAKLIKNLGGIVSIHAGNKSNSIEGITNSLPVKMAEKEDIAKHVDVFELGQESDQKGYTQKVFPKIGVHPMIICSDNHNAKKYELKQSCWIQADPTFEGLKQIKYEPQRVKIQQDSPGEDFEKTFVDEIGIKDNIDTEGFVLKKQRLKLNKDMITVIGGRGSGKSTLLSLIAQINCEADDQLKEMLKGVNLDYSIYDKSVLGKENIKQPGNSCESFNYPIYYITQGWLANKAKSQDVVRQELLNSIGVEEVSTNYYQINNEIESKLRQIEDLEDIITKIEEETEFYENRKNDEDELKKYLERKLKDVEETKQKYQNPSVKKKIEKIEELFKKGMWIKNWQEQGHLSRLRQDYINLNTSIQNFKNKTEPLFEELELKDKSKDLIPDEIDLETINNSLDRLEEELEKKKQDFRDGIKKSKGELIRKQDLKEDVGTLLSAIENIQQQETKLKSYLEQLLKAREKIAQLRNEISEIFNPTRDSEHSIQKTIEDNCEGIKQAFTNFIEMYKSENLFNIVFEGVEVKPHIFFDWHGHLKPELTGCFYKGQAVDLETEIFNESSSEYNHKQLFTWIAEGKIWQYFDNKRDGSKFQKDGDTRFLEILLSEWYVYARVRPQIFLSDKELSRMSIGEQATLMLRLKLATEGIKNSIILIDQPEDNLDNKFITDENNGLIPLLKKIKNHRQVIVATHNANIVVGADSDQVVVSNMDNDDSEYISGSLENPDIYQNICDILEGGNKAFEKRRNKYRLGQT